MGQSNQSRLLQIARWLAAEFPTPFPVVVRCPKKIAADPGDKPSIRLTGYYGYTVRIGQKIHIRIAVRPGINLWIQIDTLLHEWAHATTTRQSKIEDARLAHGAHDDEWALAFGRIYRRYYDDDGSEDSKGF